MGLFLRFIPAIAAGVLVLGGCTVGPDYERPVTAAQGEGFYNDWSNATDPNLTANVGQWWANLGDPCLPSLVREALEQNRNLRQAAANVARSRAFFEAARGQRLPNIEYKAGRDRRQTSTAVDSGPFGALFGGGSQAHRRVNSISTEYSQDISIRYVADVFGRLRREEAASLDELAGTQASLEALRQTIIAQVVLARIEMTTAKRLLDLNTRNIESWKQTLSVVERRYEAGVANSLDVYRARENLAAVEAAQPGFSRRLELAGQSMDVLLGRRPGSGEFGDQSFPMDARLSAVPAGLPAALLDRRPDLRAAEYELMAATERVGVSLAALYPDLTLTASGGFRSEVIERIGNTEGLVYSFVMGISAPIWQGGTLRARVRASEAQVRAAAAGYEQAVLEALGEVENALVSEQSYGKQLEALYVRLEQARQAEALARQRYSQGVERILEVLDTERRRRQAENELVSTQSQVWVSRVNLYLALGGDWPGTGETKRIAQGK